MSPRPQRGPDLSTYSGRLGANMRQRREKLGLSVDEFRLKLAAEGVEVQNAAIYSWEIGRRVLTVETLPAVAKALGTTIRRLLPEA